MAIPEHKVTLKTIAEMAGCSAAVVSTVLNGARGWNFPELNSVDHPLEEMGNAAARLLIGKIEKTGTDGILRCFRGTLLTGSTIKIKSKNHNSHS